MSSIIAINSLVKRYDSRNVVDGINLEIQQGECFGLLGPNGAGKTTTLKMIYGSVQISAGSVQVLSLNAKTDIAKIKSQIGVVPQEDGLDTDFTVFENLIVYSRYYGIPKKDAETRAHQLIEQLGLASKKNASIFSLSGGMRRRLSIARALLNNPQILILDEPTTGLDPQARETLWDLIYDFKKRGLTVVLTTHYMDEAERLCDRLAIMEHGAIRALGTPNELINNQIGIEVVEFQYEKNELEGLLSRVKDKYEYLVLPRRVLLFVKRGQDGKSILNLISSEKITVRKATLEDVFLKIAGYEIKV